MSRSFRLGLFIAAALTILLIAIFLIGSQQSRFRSTYRLLTHFHNVMGLQDGADVRVGGVHTGIVKKIVLPGRPDGDVTVLMDLDRQTLGVVNRGSMASIKSEGLLGDKYIEVSFGQTGAAPLKNGDSISGEPPIDFSDLVKKANQILGTTDQAVQNMEGTTKDLQSITAKIDQGKGTVGGLINNPGLYQRANAGVAAFQEDMEALKHNFLLRGFFKQRGYEDETELAKHRIARLPVEKPVEDFELDPAKIFDKSDSAKLKNAKMLNEAGHFLENNRFGLAVVAVSTGPTGDSDKSRTLAEARAMVVRDYLTGHFRFDDTRLKTLPVGKDVQGIAKVEILAYSTPPRADH